MNRLISPIRGVLGGLALTVLVLTGGCKGGAGKGSVVAGKVTYKGQALTAGSIAFYGADGKVSSSGIGADGSYKIADAPVGEDTVVVKVPAPVKPPPGVQMPGSDVTPVPVPEHYGDPAKSGVKQTVTAGDSTVNIDLK